MKTKNSKASSRQKAKKENNSKESLFVNPSPNLASQMPDVELNGTPFKINPKDIDGDGVIGGIENMQASFGGDSGVTPIVQTPEMSEVLRIMNEDVIDNNTGMRSIDVKTRINVFERNSLAALDTVAHMHVCKPTILTHIMKRLNVSLGGRGREESVRVIVGEREQRGVESGGGMFSGIMDKLKGNNK